MKRIICLLLAAVMSLMLFSCSAPKYEPQESTDEEKQVMMTLELDSERYDVRYELYRALFLNFASEYADRGEGFLGTDEGREAIEKINLHVMELITDIYGALHLAKQTGFDPYSSDADKAVGDLIAEDVDGPYYEGNYEKYLAELKKMNMNYAVQDLVLRYQLAYDHIIEYYTGTLDFDNPSADMEEGAIKYTEQNVRDFYFGNDCVRVSVITVNHALSLADAQRIRDNVAAKATVTDALNYAISATISDPADIYNGVVIGKESVDYVFYGDVKSAAFSLAVGEASEVIEISRDIDSSWWILYRTEKSEEHFTECYEEIASAYVSQKIGEILRDVKDGLTESLTETDEYKNLDHTEISM